MFGHKTGAAGENLERHFAFGYLEKLKVNIDAATDPNVVVDLFDTYLKVVDQDLQANKDNISVELKVKLHTLQQEACIKAFTKLATLRKGATEFNDFELEQLSKLPYIPGANGDVPHFAFPAERIDRSMTKHFEYGNQWLYLLGRELPDTSSKGLFSWLLGRGGKSPEERLLDPYRKDLAYLLLGWAKAGLLDDSKDPVLKSLAENMKLWLAEKPEGVFNEMVAIALNKKNILNFLTEYVMDKGWAPWFKVVSWEYREFDQQVINDFSLIALACKEQNINLHAYTKHEDEILPVAEQKNDHDSYNPNNPVLKVMLDHSTNQFIILDPITTPSHLYRRLAVYISWEVLQKDPLNVCALEVAGCKGMAYLPEFAANMAKQDVVKKDEAKTVVHALGLFVQNHKGQCTDDKVAAARAIDTLNYKSKPGLFTKKNAGIVVAAAAASVVGWKLAKDK